MWNYSWRPFVGVGLLFMITKACPPPESIKPCHCTNRGEEIQIWCSHSELSSVLSGLQAVGSQLTKPIDELILENNYMPALPGKAFSPLRVIRLMLRDNKLERVAANWLAGLEESLLEVFIVEPELKSLPEDSFDMLKKMEAVTLKAGYVPRVPNFSNLPRLKYINLELPSLTELNPGRLSNLDLLETLHLVGSKGLRTLEASALQDLARLVTANFTSCGITWIHPRAMTRLPSLKELIFSDNNIVDAGEVGRSIRELPHLTILRLDSNLIDELRETSFVDIPPLEEIYLNNNKINQVQRGAFHRLPSLRKIDLNHNKIRRIFPEFYFESFDSRVEELYLMDNNIDHIMALTIIMETLPRLKYLDVSHNGLHEIMFGALRGHPTLERLHINDNNLKRVVREAFTNMPALTELRLRNNSLSNYLEMPLWNLPALKGLDLAHNEFRRLDRRVLANLESLRRLDMSKNNLLVIDPASFLGTPDLEHVNLSYNAIDVITPQTFPHLNKLFELDVGSNKLNRIVPGLPKGLEYLYMPKNRITSLPRTTSIDSQLPSLRLLDIKGNNIVNIPQEGFISMPLLRKLFIGLNSLQKIDERSFEGLGRLEILDLQDNKINNVSEYAFRDLRRLKELNLRNNRIEKFPTNLLRENIELRSLDMSHNQILQLEPKTFENNRQLREMFLSHNAFQAFPDELRSLPEIENLDLSNNRIQQLLQPLSNMKSLATLRLSKNRLNALIDGTFSNMDKLTDLDLRNNEIQYLTPYVVKSMPLLHSLRLARNKITTIPSAAFSDLPQLSEVELQENQLTHLASDSFTGVPNLLMLNLSHNLLTGLENAGLHGVKSMEILDISYNRLSRLNAPGLPNLDSLIQLKMDNNKLCNIQGSPFSKMSHLRLLSLRNNRLATLSENTFQPLRSTIYQLDIEGNPLRCSCNLLWLQSWVQEGPHLGPRCSDGSLLKDYRLSRQDCAEPKTIDYVPGCEDNSVNLKPGSNSNIRPTEDGDYVYEDYIEYEENVSIPLNYTQISSTGSPVIIASSSSPMSHYTPGDTPTLYAKPGNNDGKDQKLNGTSFTFFGMPVPSLNIGSFWGSSRNNDGKSRFPAKGRVQHVTPQKIENGFTPIIPQGGFKPIFNPYNVTEGNLEEIKPVKVNKSEPAKISQATISKVAIPKNKLRPLEADQLAQLTDIVYDKKNHSAPIFQHNRLENDIETTPMIETLPGGITDIPLTTKKSDFMKATIGSSILLENSEDIYNNTITKPPYTGGPSPLSGFLAPGGQLPPVRPQGRPTITKVTIPQIPTTSSGPPMPVAEEIQAPAKQNDKIYPESKNKSISWYFNNYNKTNLTPYVGPGNIFPLENSAIWYSPNTFMLLFFTLVIIP